MTPEQAGKILDEFFRLSERELIDEVIKNSDRDFLTLLSVVKVVGDVSEKPLTSRVMEGILLLILYEREKKATLAVEELERILKL